MSEMTRREFLRYPKNITLEDFLITVARYAGYLLHEFNSHMDSIRNAANLPSVNFSDYDLTKFFPETSSYGSKEDRRN